jgi:hypothetical protein
MISKFAACAEPPVYVLVHMPRFPWPIPANGHSRAMHMGT